MHDTLVLDSNWQPQSFCSWKRASKLLWEGRAKVVKEDEGGAQLNAASFSFGMPRVIVVKNAWVRRKRLSVSCSRRNIFVRDNGECQYCGHVLTTQEYQVEHVIPRCQGGTSVWENVVAACIRCNQKKSGMTPAQAGMKLLTKPVAPKPHDPRFNFKLHITKMRPEWKPWTSWLYWNLELDE